MPERMGEDERIKRVMNELQDSLDGCSQVRLVGRTCLFMEKTIQNLGNHLREGLEGLSKCYAVEDLSNYKLAWDFHEHDKPKYFNWRRREKDKLHFVIISSLGGGGTGTGIFMDIAAIIRGILNEPNIKDQLKYGRNAKTFGLFVLPHCMETRSNTRKLRANSYSALKELDYFLSGHPFNVDYSIFDEQLGAITLDNKTAENRLFQGVYLFEGETSSNMDIKHDHTLPSQVDKRFRVSDELSEFLLHCFIFDSCNSYWTLFPNKTAGDDTFTAIDVSSRPAEFKTLYSSFGISTLIYPFDTLIKQLKNRWMKKVAEHLVLDLEITENAVKNVLTMIRDDNSPEKALPSGLLNIIEKYQFSDLRFNSLRAVEQEINKREKSIRGQIQNIIPKLYDVVTSAYGLAISSSDQTLVMPSASKLSEDKEEELQNLVNEFKKVKTDFEKEKRSFDLASNYDEWRTYYNNCLDRYKQLEEQQTKPKKSLLAFLSPPQPRLAHEIREAYIDDADLNQINAYLRNVLHRECYEHLSRDLDEIITSLDKIISQTKELQEKQFNVLDRLIQELNLEAEKIALEYSQYDEDLNVKNLRSRCKYNLMSSSQELTNLSNELKKAVQLKFDQHIDLRGHVTPKVRESIIRKKGVENCNEVELYREIENRMEDYLNDFKFKEFFYSQSLGDPHGFLARVSQNLNQFETDMKHYSAPYIKIRNHAKWVPAPYTVTSMSGGHRNKITKISMMGGFSAHSIESLSDWRKEYTAMKEKHIMHVFSKAEEAFPDLAYVDRNIKKMDPDKLVKIMIKSGYLRMIDKQIIIHALLRKTKKLFNRIVRVKTNPEDFANLFKHELKNKTLILDNYLDSVWYDKGKDFDWLYDIPWIGNLYGQGAFSGKYKHIFDKMDDLDIKPSKKIPAFDRIVSIFQKHGFVRKEKEDLVFNSNIYLQGDSVGGKIVVTEEELAKELHSNKWFLEELVLGFCEYLRPESTNVHDFSSDLQGYLDAERGTLPEIIKLEIEKKLRKDVK